MAFTISADLATVTHPLEHAWHLLTAGRVSEAIDQVTQVGDLRLATLLAPMAQAGSGVGSAMNEELAQQMRVQLEDWQKPTSEGLSETFCLLSIVCFL